MSLRSIHIIAFMRIPYLFKARFCVYGEEFLCILEKAMATHSSTLAWKIDWTEEPGRLQSMGLLRVEHDWATLLHFSLSCIGEGNSNPFQCSYLESPRDGGAWWAAVYGVAQSWTWVKQLSSIYIYVCVYIYIYIHENVLWYIYMKMFLSI